MTVSVRNASGARIAAPVHLRATGRWNDAGGDIGWMRSLIGTGPGAIYDFTNPALLAQQTNGSGIVTGGGQSVGRVLDLGPLGAHLQQAAVAQRPMTAFNAHGRMVVMGDGVDDTMQTAAPVDFTTREAVTLVAAFHKATDPGTRMVLAHNDTSVPSFNVRAPHGAGANVTVAGGAETLVVASLLRPAPTDSVIVGRATIAGGYVEVTADGGTWVRSALSLGAGAFASAPLRIFAANASGGPSFGGQIGFLAVLPGLATDQQAARLWRIAATKWGVPQ